MGAPWKQSPPSRWRTREERARSRPMMCEMRNLVVEGCLATYSASFPAQYARMADYVDRVLRGARADSLPVEQPREFEFVINARTARELGLEINPAIRLRATEVLQ